ncbi:hypothetical protein HYX19_01015 [Candidatus Woesearchaeota archaeon]|nr:hypothetical protein [Candidatus Woesearchaeota archaeon]
MVWKTWTEVLYDPVIRECNKPREKKPVEPKKRQEGSLIALVGDQQNRMVSFDREKEHLERLCKISDDILGYNLDGRMVLMKCGQNESKFDVYISLPFVKGVTERGTGRTLLILGSDAHHGEAMQNQFNDVVYSSVYGTEIDTKKYGNTIRWINVGDTKNGFIGLDYNPLAKTDDGVAINCGDIKFVARTLLDLGYDSCKRLFLLKPPFIVEREEGKKLRQRGIETLLDHATSL